MISQGVFLIIVIVLIISLEVYFYFTQMRNTIVKTTDITTGTTSQSIPMCGAPGGTLGFDGINWTCTCLPGWSGSNCSVFTSSSATTPKFVTTGLTLKSIPQCVAPGGSLGYDGKNWSCKCGAGWSGSDCSTYIGTDVIPMNLSVPKCYSPGGMLSYDGKNWTCNCATGWSGVGCGTYTSQSTSASQSAKDILLNNIPICTAPGGSLGYNGDRLICSCNTGYFGPSCDQTTTGNSGPNCHFGVAVYDSVSAMWSCNCNHGYTGCNCSLPTDPPPDIGSLISTCF
jgi:hypothetical protein